MRTFERRRLRVYVAGPISKGDRYENLRAGERWGRRMVRDGLAPYVPHLDNVLFPHPNDLTWNVALEWDLEWVSVSDAVFRIPGASQGADLECEVANTLGIPVFGAWDDDSDDLETEYHDLLAWAAWKTLAGVRSIDEKGAMPA